MLGRQSTAPINDLGPAMTDMLEHDVHSLALPEGRPVGSPGHTAAQRYITERLTAIGARGYGGGAYALPYTVHGGSFANLLARLPGADDNAAPIVLTAHYDTCGPQPGADDNAAAVAIALRIAEHLLAKPAHRPIIAAFFDAEEPPYYLTEAMGSIHFYHHQRREPVHGALALDLVGHDVPLPGLDHALFITGMESDPGLADVLQETQVPKDATRELLAPVPALNRYVGDMSDHHVFRVNERPYLFLTCGRWMHYHQPTDIPENLNFDKIAAIAEYTEALLRAMAEKPLEGPFEGYDSTPVELAFLDKAIGGLVGQFGINLEKREDIDRLAVTLMAQFGL